MHLSLGVEPVDHDVMKRPPRQAKERMINVQLLSQVLTSALVIVAGTLFVFWREVSWHKAVWLIKSTFCSL